MFWLFFVSNELWFFIFIMIPTVALYKRAKNRNVTLIYLTFLIVCSIAYLITVTAVYDLTTLMTVYSINETFDPLYKRPFGPCGYYALGAMLSIFYYEFSLNITQRAAEN